MVVMRNQRIGIFFLSLMALLMMIMGFAVHGAASESTKITHPQNKALLEEAIQNKDFDRAEKYKAIIKDGEWALNDEFTIEKGYQIGSIGGVIVFASTFFVYGFVTKRISEKRGVELGSSILFLVSSTVGIIFIITYEVIAGIFHSHLTSNMVDITIVVSNAITLTFVFYMYILLDKRLANFHNVKDKDHQRYLKSLELENKTWSQVFQSLVFAIIFLFFGIYVASFINAQVSFQLSNQAYVTWLVYQSYVAGLILFGIIFGILGRVLWYLGKLSELLSNNINQL